MEHGKGVHARHLFPIWVAQKDRDSVITILSQNGVGSTVNFRSIPDLSFYSKKYPEAKLETPVASNWGRGVLSIPLYPNLKEDDVAYVLNVIKTKVVGQIAKIGDLS